jgi:hypothetical protein
MASMAASMRLRVDVVTAFEQRGDGVVEHLGHDFRGRVFRPDAGVHIRHAGDQAAGQFQLEIGQARAAHGAAEANHRGLADAGIAGDIRHCGLHHGVGLLQHQFGHLAFGRRQGF